MELDAVNLYEKCSLPGLEMNETQYNAKFTAFKLATFNENIHFERTNLSIGLVFDTCKFMGRILLEDVKAHGFDDKINPYSESIVFKNCTFEKLVNICGKDTIIERNVFFENCTFKKGLNIENTNVSNGGITIEKCVFHERLDLQGIKAKQDLTLRENEINCYVRIRRLRSSWLIISGENTVKGEIHIVESNLNMGIAFNNGEFGKEVKLSEVVVKNSGLSIINSTFDQSFFVNYHNEKERPTRGISTFYFKDTTFTNGIFVNGTNDLFADFPIVDEIVLNLSSELKGDIVFRNLHVGILSISGNSSSANILLDSLFINQIKIKSLINNGGLILSMIRASYIYWFSDKENKRLRENAIYIDDSNFGKAQFFQVDFSSFSKVVFRNNILIDISTSLVKWFKPDQLNNNIEKSLRLLYKESLEHGDKNRIRESMGRLISVYQSQQEVYRQLKVSSQKQGDIPQSLEFQRYEMDYYRKVVNLNSPQRCGERLILWSNQSNDFGQNWLKALGLLLLFSFLSYLPIGFLTSNEIDYTQFATSFSDISINLRVMFYDNLKSWMVLLNPAHRIGDLGENINQFSSWLYFWDILSRIIVSYFLFQIVSAFRKFSK